MGGKGVRGGGGGGGGRNGPAILNPFRCASNVVGYRFLFQVINMYISYQWSHANLMQFFSMVNCAWDSFCSNQICNYKVASTALAWTSDQLFTLKIQIMSGGDTDNHMYGTLDVVSVWSLYSF